MHTYDKVHLGRRNILQLVENQQAGIADEHIHPVSFLNRPIKDSLGSLGFGKVRIERLRIHPELCPERLRHLDIVFLPIADYQYVIPLCSKLSGIFQSHTGRSAGNESIRFLCVHIQIQTGPQARSLSKTIQNGRKITKILLFNSPLCRKIVIFARF